MACVTTDESGPGTAGGFCHDETNVEAGEPQQERGSAGVGDPRFGAEAGEQGLERPQCEGTGLLLSRVPPMT